MKYDLIVGRSICNSDYIISVSNTTNRDIKKLFCRESVVIPEGINKLYGSNLDESFLIQNKLGKNQYLLYVGNTRPHKNVNFLIDCFLNSDSNKLLVLCGNYNNLKKVNNERILYLDYVSDSQLKLLYQNCAAFIYPSKYEGFGLPVLEALANGAKVFCSTGGALSEFPKNAVKYFDPDDKHNLVMLIEHVDDVFVDLQTIDQTLNQYTWENTFALMDYHLQKWLKDV